MKMQGLRALLLAGILACVFTVATGQNPAVWTQHNSNSRLGNNNDERRLTPANVNRNSFGKLFSYKLDDQTYAQPLYIPNLQMAVDGRFHNVVFVTAVNNSVYAWDADSNTANQGQPLWKTNLTPVGERVPNAEDYRNLGACDGRFDAFAGNMGMVGTPVIDTTSSTLYVVAHTILNSNGQHIQRLHALGLGGGKPRLSPTVIKTDFGRERDRNFDPKLNLQRPALTLVNGIVYVGFASYCDLEPYHGWVIGYRASNLSQVTAWSTTVPPGKMGGVWQSGQGLMADAKNNLYLMTGNGTVLKNAAASYGMSAVRLTPGTTGKLTVSSYFTPCNEGQLNGQDLDMGSAGLIPIPGTDLVVGGGKGSVLYVMRSDKLGGNVPACPNTNIVQEFQAVFSDKRYKHIHGSPIYYNTGSKEYVYLWGENDFLRVYEFLRSPQRFNSTAVATSAVRAPQIPQTPDPNGDGSMPGGFLSISSTNQKTNAIVWALAVYACNANEHVQPGILYAFDASQFTGSGPTRQLKKLWDSRENTARDDVGYFAKFTYPTIANGKVYVAGWGPVPSSQMNQCAPDTVPGNQGQLSVYGPR